ncbi:DUF2637 domain-containing protein [Rothia sp. AR01]|uniref:DUF2637 domain-containing protein n=1 Tax=Rothia santali TaxID=2949643 RepID=A0A9X2KIA6_9MICC|nr:DUF2637 domain-containing protein [Rothia santali]MCP3425815.1 DUF2637 domain-containing protein [Rothia santali]
MPSSHRREKAEAVNPLTETTTPAQLKTTARNRAQLRSSYQAGDTPVSKSSGPRINPDSRSTLWLTVVLICTLGLTSFMVSFNGLHDVAGWVGLPVWMRWAVPVFIDIAILAYSMAAVIHRSRQEKVWPTWTTLGAFTLISVIANAAHALAAGETETTMQSWIGAGIAAMAPVAVFAATEEISRLAFAAAPALPEVVAEAEPEATEADDDAAEDTAAPLPLAEVPAEATPAEAPVVADEQRPADRPVSAPAAPLRNEQAASRIFDPQPATQFASWKPGEPVREPQGPVKDVPGPVERQGQKEPAESRSAPAEPAPSESDPDGLVAWVKSQHAEGVAVTGKMVGAFLGKSDRTGRNRLTALKEERPELFELEEAK